MGRDLLDGDGEPHDAGDQREVGQAERVACEQTFAVGRRGHVAMLGGILQPPEIGPPKQGGDNDRCSGSRREGAGPLIVGHRGPGDDQRFAARDDHEQTVPLGQVRRVQIPGRVPSGDGGHDEVGEDRQEPDPRPHGRIDDRASDDEHQAHR